MPEEENNTVKEGEEVETDVSSAQILERELLELKEALGHELEEEDTKSARPITPSDSKWLAQTAAVKKEYRIQACEKLGLTWDEFEGQERLLTFATNTGVPVEIDIIDAITKMRLRIDEIAYAISFKAPKLPSRGLIRRFASN